MLQVALTAGKELVGRRRKRIVPLKEFIANVFFVLKCSKTMITNLEKIMNKKIIHATDNVEIMRYFSIKVFQHLLVLN